MHETPAASAAFEEYCAIGDSGIRRSLEKLHELYQLRARQAPDKKIYIPSLTTLKIWSSKYDWQERVKAYDVALITKEAEERRRKRDEAIELMHERHAQIGVTQQAAALKQIKALMDGGNFGSMAVVQLLKLATELERMARGEPSVKVEHSGVVEFATEWGGGKLEDE